MKVVCGIKVLVGVKVKVICGVKVLVGAIVVCVGPLVTVGVGETGTGVPDVLVVCGILVTEAVERSGVFDATIVPRIRVSFGVGVPLSAASLLKSPKYFSISTGAIVPCVQTR